MLMTSSATRNWMSSSSARAIRSRWSCPPLSWCGYLCRTWAGSSETASSEASSLLSHSCRLTPEKYASLIILKTRSALKIGL